MKQKVYILAEPTLNKPHEVMVCFVYAHSWFDWPICWKIFDLKIPCFTPYCI